MLTALELTVLDKIENNERITINKIADEIHCTRRTVEKAIEALREHGIPICSDCSTLPYGMYLARTEAEAKQWVRQLYSRINKLFSKCRLINNYFAYSKIDAKPISLFDNSPVDGIIPERAALNSYKAVSETGLFINVEA